MLDPTSWFGGHDDEDDDPVRRTLRYLGLEGAGSTISQGVQDVGAGVGQAASNVGAAVQPYLPQPSTTPAPEDYSFAPPDNPLATGLSAAGKAGVEAYQETGSPLSPWSAPALAPARAAYIAERALPEIGGEIGAAAGRAVAGPDAAPYFTVPESVPVVGGQDVGAEQVGRFVGSGLTDPLTYVGAAGSAAAGAPARRVAAELARGLPGVGEAELLGRGAIGAARGLGSRAGEALGLAGNAERVAAADARMAAEGSTVAPGIFGAVPPERWGRPSEQALRSEVGKRYPDIRGDVHGTVRETLGEPSAEMLADSRYPRDAVHPDLRAAGIGPEITPQIDLSGRMNAGFGVVPDESRVSRTRQASPPPMGAAESPASAAVREIQTANLVAPSRMVELIGDRPEYLADVAQHILAQRRKVVSGAMTPRDTAKAYYMTLASQGADAIKVSTVEAKVPGFRVPEQFWSAERAADGSALVRPEEAAAAWLFTPKGQAALNDIERGVMNREAWREGQAVRTAFGDDRFRTNNVFSERAPVNGRTQFNMDSIQAFTDRFNELARTGTPSDLLEFSKRLNGIREAKAPFLNHALGFGETPTIDAVEISAWLTGQGDVSRLEGQSAALKRRIDKQLKDKRVGAALGERIGQQFDEMRRLLPSEATADLPPEVFNHVLHHWIWDRMKGTATTHTGFYDALRNAATMGTLPTGAATDRLGAVNRVLGQGIASSVSGGVGAQVNQEMNPDDPLAGIKGFAAGALVPPLAARGGMALARRAGAVGERTGGALATLGNVPAGAADDAARQARRARIAARGPLPELPEGAVPIRATPEAEVARLRLDLFPPDARADIQAAAEGVDYARGQRRGVLSDEAVRDLADDDARSVDRLIKGSKAGRAYNPEETVAVRNAVASQANRVRDLSVQIAEARTGGATPDLLVARRAAEATKLQALVQIAEGARAEAGRTLRQYATQARLIELDPNAAITRIRGKIADPDEYAKIVDEYTEIVNDGADPIQLAKLWAKVERGEITGSDLFGLYRRFNMLSGPRTFEVNALSGALNLGYEVASRAGMQALKGRGSEMAAEVAAPLKAGARAFQNLAETMWHGVSAEQAARGDVPRNLSARTDNPAARAALTALEVPDRLNAGVDQFFRTLTEEWAATSLAHKQARASGLTPRSPDWAETVATKLEGIREDVSKHPEVKAMADRVTFSEEPGGIVKGLEDLKRRSPNLVGFVAPFIRTPANIASRAVDISPLGPVRTAIEAATGLGRGRANLGTRVRDNVIGTAATTWAYTKARQGELTGAGPDDPEKLAELRATGWQPYSIKIGDQYWSYANFAPFSLALSAGAAAAEAQQYAKPGKDDVVSMLADGAARTGKVVTDMTVLAGLGAVIKAQQDPDRYGTQWLTTALTQLMPAGSFVNTVGQATDPLVRRSERTDVATQVGQNLRARVPGLRETVPAAQDPLGRDIESEQTGWGALNPFRPTTERDEPVLRAFLDAGVDIGKPRQDLTISAYDDAGRVTESIAMPLTAAEQREWNRLRGEALSSMLEAASQDPAFAARPGAVKERYLRDKLEAANAYATRTVRGQIGGEEIGRRVAPLRRAG